ncbi:MAG TPA: phenylalanine--tRNA ligase subunit beta, partial [Steroidobacteraceae bacterium]|nr:phenylalanine--tRNA ligase subunit beta [Steroidobacteraceae bacterium]
VPDAVARVEAPHAAPRLLTRRITGLNNHGTTPLWMQERLRRAGLRSINPVVDVTNYMLLEQGQPMHAYDARRVQGTLCVRHARPGEKLTLLDERIIEPAPDELLIADDSGPIGLAGIMGGHGTSITPEVTDVLLEVAYFAPEAIVGRARRHGLQTDASQRFERGVNPLAQITAMNLATAMLLQFCGGAAGAVHEVCDAPSLPVRAPIRLRRERLALLSGASIADARVAAVLSGLGMQLTTTADGWEVKPPAWRFDLAIEADLIEEVLRMVGFDAVQEQPKLLPQRFRRHPETRPDERALLDTLTARGYLESINYAFVDPVLQRRMFPGQRAIALANPIASDLSVMRVSLWPALLKAATENLSRQQDRVRLFERGRVFLLQDGHLEEVARVAGIVCGARLPEQWGSRREGADFFDLKSDVEALLALAGPSMRFEWQAGGPDCLHPGRSATVLRDGRAIGWLGELHPSIAAERGVGAGCLLFELDIIPATDAALPQVQAVSRFPQVRRDLSITVPLELPLSAVRTRVSVAAGSLLRELRVFDLYQGPGIESTRKSIALGLIFQDNNKTLKDDEADALMASVAADLSAQLGAKVRD